MRAIYYSFMRGETLMEYFTEEKHDIEGYRNNLKFLDKVLDTITYNFLLNTSFHDSLIREMIVSNNYNPEVSNDSQESIVTVSARIEYWDNTLYELSWNDVTVYSFDFDVSRSKVAETQKILFNRGLDEWSLDELTLITNDRLRHEIIFFSQTIMIIECSNFSIKLLDE
ncbi:hypothetical protein CAR_c01560 [Carnobacterium sp. 17-4]|nr:hypothetical protein CAR_c01560 [Carnobacterium sp. 17-4]